MRFKKHARIAQEVVAAGQLPERSYTDAVTLYAFLGIVVFFLSWFLSGDFLWSLIVVGALFLVACALHWHLRRRRLRSEALRL